MPISRIVIPVFCRSSINRVMSCGIFPKAAFDLFLRKLPANAGDELADLLMSRYEKSSLIITSNRSVDDWGKLLGDVVVAAPLLDRIIHHGHLLKFEGKSWRMKEAAERLAKRAATA